MIKSMTGFGRSEVLENNRKFTVEIKSVNHRYFDVNIRMPKNLGYFEAAIRNTLKKFINRGKIDLFISMEDYSEGNYALKYNEQIAAEYVDYYKKMAEQFHLENDIRVSTLARCPEVLTLEDKSDNVDEIWESLEKALEGACKVFVETREKEGVNLQADLFSKLDHLDANVVKVQQRYPKIVEEYTNRIHDKVRELLDDKDIDEARIAQELVMFSDKLATDEETVRLHSHIASMKQTLTDGENIGRKLDFIAQEMNREANTILSKANDLETSNIAIDMKTEIEKIREQIQNIE